MKISNKKSIEITKELDSLTSNIINRLGDINTALKNKNYNKALSHFNDCSYFLGKIVGINDLAYLLGIETDIANRHYYKINNYCVKYLYNTDMTTFLNEGDRKFSTVTELFAMHIENI